MANWVQGEWLENVLKNLSAAGADGQAAVDFITSQGIRIGFRKQSKSTGAMVWFDRGIHLNPHFYSTETAANDPYLLSLVAHEARHLQQGWLTTLSIYGELDAWKLGFRIYYGLTHAAPHPAIREMLSLPTSWERSVLRRAQVLMRQYAGKGYYANLLPLYPLHRELWYWLTRRVPQ